jgi:hypothetical protein
MPQYIKTLIQVGLAIIWIHIGLDYIYDQPIGSLYNETYQLNIRWCGVTSAVLSLTIGFLFVTQVRSLSMNLTTI